MLVEREEARGAHQPRARAAIEREHRAGELRARLHVQDAKLTTDLPVWDALVARRTSERGAVVHALPTIDAPRRCRSRQLRREPAGRARSGSSSTSSRRRLPTCRSFRWPRALGRRARDSSSSVLRRLRGPSRVAPRPPGARAPSPPRADAPPLAADGGARCRGPDLIDLVRETPRRPRAAFTTSGSRRSWARSIMRRAYRRVKVGPGEASNFVVHEFRARRQSSRGLLRDAARRGRRHAAGQLRRGRDPARTQRRGQDDTRRNGARLSRA